MRRLVFFSFVERAVPGSLPFVNSGSPPWFKAIRVGIEGPNISKSRIPTFLRLPFAIASARLTEQVLEMALSLLQGGTDPRLYSSQLLLSRSRPQRSFSHSGWGVSVEVRHVSAFPAGLYACGVNPRVTKNSLSLPYLLTPIARRCSPEDFHVGDRGKRETLASI